MASSSGKWYNSQTPRNINSSANEPMQNIFADIVALWGAVFGGTGSIASNIIAAVTGTFSGVVTAVGGMVTDTISEYTAAAGVTIDGVLLKDGLVVKKAAAVSVTGVTQTLNCGGNDVIFLTTTTAADLAKLSNSAITDGHEIELVHAVDGGELTLSKLNAGDGIGFTTITFTNAGDTAKLVWSNTISAWFITAVNGAVVA